MRNPFKLLYTFFADEVNRFYFFQGGRKSGLLDDETRMWRCFLYLKSRYEPFLNSLPEFTLPENPINPRIIWWCWLQGENKAPELCQACLRSLRRELPDFRIQVITLDNLSEFISIPDFIQDKFQRGIISPTHYSDIIRTLLLIEYGGVWIDSTVFCTGYRFPVFDYPFFVYQNWKFNQQNSAIASNWLISSCKAHPLLITTKELLYEYWKSNEKIVNYYIFHLFFHIAVERYPTLWYLTPRYSNIPPHILQFELFDQYNEARFEQIAAMSDFHKLTWKYPNLNIFPEDSFISHLVQL